MNNVQIQNKVVLVTGAESGIGRAVAGKMLETGARVVGADLEQKWSHGANKEQYLFVKTDLTEMEDLERLFAETEKHFGSIDVLVNCAGITGLEGIFDITPESWDKMMSINVKAVFFCCQKALQVMLPGKAGKIINISSNAGKSGGKAVGAHYSASKAGVINITKTLALFAADYGITVNCVAPGPTRTPMTDRWGGAVNEGLIEKIPLKRFAEPDEVAEAVLFSVSPSAAFITG